ncbi:MAG: GTPase Era [Deltaproteobacteria bacterium]|nr:GTPase Era [Deltaproteobacteria bacterium]
MTVFKSGFIAISGAPNAGKSTLLNRMIGQKISITSRKPQTTRNRILGVVHGPSSQIVFIDTPGIHNTKSPLNVRMVDVAISAFGDADLILVLVDASRPDPASEELIIRQLGKQNQPVILALNKIDLVKKPVILEIIDKWAGIFQFESIIPVSAKHGTQVSELLSAMKHCLPEGPAFFPEETLTDLPERFIAAEIIREKVFRLTGQEVPYATAVTIDSFFEEKNGLVKISAVIHIERDSQKGIIIGKKGSKLKEIGEQSRKDIETMMGAKVFLKLFVRVQKNWSRDTKAIRKFGY